MPSDPTVSDTQAFQVTDGQPVTITVTIGNAMVGATTLVLKGQTSNLPESGTAVVGNGGGVKDSVLHTITTVTDTNPATNETVVTYDLKCGENTFSKEYSVKVNDGDGHALYLIDFMFF
jgi:hypothetical protein